MSTTELIRAMTKGNYGLAPPRWHAQLAAIKALPTIRSKP